MTSPSVTPGGVPLNPPPPGEPEGRAETPVAGQTHDIVLGGVGFTLYRARDEGPPTKGYTNEAVDYTYTPTFVPRQNQSGDMGDDQQDFFMTVTQNDWSGGEGRKFFRRQGGEDAFWAGENIMPTYVPGQVKMARSFTFAALAGATITGWWNNAVYVKSTGQIASPANEVGDALFSVYGPGATTKVIARYSVDGGATWTVQTTTAASAEIWNDCIDMTVGDDGYVYCLEGATTTTQAQVHRIKGPSATTADWDNWTAITGQCSCICYWNKGVYVGTAAGKLGLTTSAGGAVDTIQDFGGGVVIQLLGTPEGMYALYLSPQGDYRVFLYDGSTTREVFRLPRGWSLPYMIETGVMPNKVTSSIFAMRTDAMAWSEGVLYVAGLLPSQDAHQAHKGDAPYHSALYYYSSGSSGLVWEADSSKYHHSWGCAAVSVIQGGIIVWVDGQNDRVMAYDPTTSGAFCLTRGLMVSGALTSLRGTNPGTVAVSLGAGPTMTLTNANSVYPGTIIHDSTRSSDTDRSVALGADPSGVFAPASAGANLYVKKNWDNTGYTVANFSAGDTIAVDYDPPWPVMRLVFDFTNGTLGAIHNSIGHQATTHPIRYFNGNYSYCPLRSTDMTDAAASGVHKNQGWITTSFYDFESSLKKYFRTVQIDFDPYTSVEESLREGPGLVHLFYRTDVNENFYAMSRLFDEYGSSSNPVGYDTHVRSLFSTSITSVVAQSATTVQIVVASASATTSDTSPDNASTTFGIQAGDLIYNTNTSEYGLVTVKSGTTLTIHRYYLGYGAVAGGTWAAGNTVTIQKPLTSGHRYYINQTAGRIQFNILLIPSPTDGLSAGQGVYNLGPSLRKLSLRAAPIQRGYRRREYQIAMFNDQSRVSSNEESPKETRTPAEVRKALEVLISANTPISCSDNGMSSVTCVFIPEDCKIRELKPNEYVAYIALREV